MNYKGKGNHSVRELEEIIEVQAEKIHQLLIIKTKPVPLYLAIDPNDGEALAGFTDESGCRENAENSGCYCKEITLY